MTGQCAILGSARGGQLFDHLLRAGHVTERGVTRRVTARACQRCGGALLVGLDDDVCALEATVDPQPLSALGEALALLEGRGTWHLRRERDRFVLDPRDQTNIRAHPAGSRAREDVLREHRCHTTAPGPSLIAPTQFPETKPRPPLDAVPTF